MKLIRSDNAKKKMGGRRVVESNDGQIETWSGEIPERGKEKYPGEWKMAREKAVIEI
jgi:hypothetical protein